MTISLKQPVAQIQIRQDVVKLKVGAAPQISNFQQPRIVARIDGNVIVRNFYGSTGIQAIAGETISALRACYVENGVAYVLSSGDVDHASMFAGIAMTAALRDAELTLLGSGVMEDVSWSWLPRLPVFIGPDGRLTQTPPLSGFWQQVAVPLAATKLEISPKIAIQL